MNSDTTPTTDNYSYSTTDVKGKRYYVSRIPEYEFASPKDYLLEILLNSRYRVMRLKVEAEGIAGDEDLIRIILAKWALRKSEEDYAAMLTKVLPYRLLALLATSRKSEQQRLTKGMVITTGELEAFIAQAGHAHGFTYSQYRSDHYPKGLDKTRLPNIIIKEADGSITKVGKTPLANGELKNVMLHRKVIIAKFFDRGDDWHCFIYTYKSLDGTEPGDWGSHIHYMSDKWGVSRADVVAGIRAGRYVSSGLPHIKFPRLQADLHI